MTARSILDVPIKHLITDNPWQQAFRAPLYHHEYRDREGQARNARAHVGFLLIVLAVVVLVFSET
jgi:hypothetical protein